MGYSITTRNMVCISSYAEAKAHWDKTKPWVDTDSCPLAGRRETNKALRRGAHNSYFSCKLYATPLVIYHSDGGIELNTHHSVSSRKFMDYVAPKGCKPVFAFGNTFWEINTEKGVEYRLHVEAKPIRTGVWKITGSSRQATELVKDAPLCGKIRRNLKPYANWYGVTNRLIDLPGECRVQHMPTHHLDEITKGMLDPQSFPDIVNYLGSPETYSFYDRIYRAAGALKPEPVPFNRLPRNAP